MLPPCKEKSIPSPFQFQTPSITKTWCMTSVLHQQEENNYRNGT